MSASLAVATPVAAAVKRAAQPPRLLYQVAEAARKRGASEPTTDQPVSWVRAYILFHGNQHPRDLGLPALVALEAARAALELLCKHVLDIDLGELPRPQPPRLLDQMNQVLRVRHYSPRTEACYLHWARCFILFHGKRHPCHMGGAEVALFRLHLAVGSGVSETSTLVRRPAPWVCIAWPRLV